MNEIKTGFLISSSVEGPLQLILICMTVVKAFTNCLESSFFFSFVKDNWIREVNLWCPELQVLFYYGKKVCFRVEYLQPKIYKKR